MISQKQIDKIVKCFTYKGQTFCYILENGPSELHIRPNEPWDIEWANLKLEDTGDFSLTWKWKGKDNAFTKDRLKFSEVCKILKVYRG